MYKTNIHLAATPTLTTSNIQHPARVHTILPIMDSLHSASLGRLDTIMDSLHSASLGQRDPIIEVDIEMDVQAAKVDVSTLLEIEIKSSY